MAINGSGRFIGPGMPIRDGLIGWYDNRYKEPSLNTGQPWVDISGASNTMTDNSSPIWRYGYYFDLDGTDDYFRNTSMGTHSSYTLEFWGQKDDTSTDYIMDGRDHEHTSSWWWLTEYQSYDNNYNGRAKTNWSNGYLNWHQQVIVDNNSTSVLYINGESINSSTDGQWNSNELTIGAGHDNDAEWNGKIGCVRIYNKALTATEVRHNFMLDAGKFGITIEGTS